MDCVLQKSVERPGWWILSDRHNMIVVRFEEKRYNATKEVVYLFDHDDELLRQSPDYCHIDYYKYICMLDWLMQNHRDLMDDQDESLRLLIGED